MARNYVDSSVLVETDWVAQHKSEPNIRVVESDEDILLYEQGHVPGAVKVDWQTELQDQVVRDYINKEKFEALLSDKGIGNEHTVVFYGDKNNWWACYAFWTFKMYGHDKCLIMNGGRKKWLDEKRETTREVPKYAKTSYKAKGPDNSIRAFRDEVLKHIQSKKPLIDVRSPGEYTGELLHMENYPQEGALRGGHIPGAANIPWSQACKEDGTFKSADDLWALYHDKAGLKENDDVIAYCRIGERSSLTWFVLKYLLGFKQVRNYDGSWTEWGNLVAVPIEKPFSGKSK